MPKGINEETKKSHRFIDRSGSRRGRLTFISFSHKNSNKHSVWKCLCDCGSECLVSDPKTKSCGCLRREVAAKTQRAKRLPDEVRAQRLKENAERQRMLRKASPVRSMQARLSRLHRHAIAMVGSIKTSPTFESLGYTAEELRVHIEKQFLKGMSWENMRDWQIDHIIPISSAKTESDVVALNQLSNLRPMFSKDNNAKKNKIESLL